MAASTQHLIAQLNDKLHDDNVPLEERLDIAKKIFCSSMLPVLQKEERVLSWIIEVLQNGKCDAVERKMCYDSLLYCFKSNRMKSYNGNIKMLTKVKILEVLKPVDCPEDLLETICRCCYEVVSTPFFQRLFMCDVCSANKLTGYYFSSITTEKSTEDFIATIDHYLYINKMCLLKRDFRYSFIKEVLTPLCLALVHSPKDKSAECEMKAITVFKEVLFYEPKFIENYIDINTVKTVDPTNDVRSFNKKIRHMPAKHDPQVVNICYSVFLKSVISKYPEKLTQMFRIFTVLTPPLGIVVNQIRSIEMNPVHNWQIDNSFAIIKSLVDILDKSKVPLSCQLEDVTLQNWFTGLVIGLTNINNKTFSINLLEMINRVLEFNPLVIEPASKALTMIMLQIKKPNIKDAYIRLIKTVISGSSKIQRLQKFISFFLQHMRECLIVSCEDDLVLDDVLPKEVAEEFCEAIPQLPHSQVLSMLKSLTFHLQRDILPSVEAFQTDTSVCINMEVISEMIYQLIYGTTIADHSVPDIVKQKFKHILEEMQQMLKQFGIVFQEIHEDRLLRPYFQLCKAFGAMKLLFREYENIQIVPPMEVDLEPTNLCYVHNYLFPENWKKITHLLEKHEDCEAMSEYFELLVQKIEAVAQVEEGYEGPGTQVARYLLNLAGLEWLWDHLTTLAPLFQSAELAVLVKKIVDFIDDDQSRWLPLIKGDPFSENRRLVLATGFQLMTKASEGLSVGGDESVSHQVLSLIDISSLLEYELSQLITDDFELKEGIEEALDEMASILNETLLVKPEPVDYIPHPSLFEVPARLPLHHFSVLNQCCAVLSAVALLYQLPFDSEADMYLFNLLLKIMDGPKRNDKGLLRNLNHGVLLRFVGTRGLNYRGQRKLMKRICFNAFQAKPMSKKLFKEICSPLPEDLWVTAVVVDSLMEYKNKYLGQSEGSKKPLEKKKCLDHLISSMIPLLCSEKPSLDHLYSYSVVFKYMIQQGNNGLDQLTPNLKEYVEFAMTSYKSGSLLIQAMIQHRDDMKDEDFPSWLMTRTWHLLRTELMEPLESVFHLIYETSLFKEFVEMVTALLKDTESELEKNEWEYRLINLFHIWCHLASSMISSEKSTYRDEALAGLFTSLSVLPSRWNVGRDYNVIPVIFELISTVAKNTSISLRPVMVDTYLSLLLEVPLPLDCGEILIAHLNHCIDAMFALYLFRTSLVIDRLPAFLECFQEYPVKLAIACEKAESQDFLVSARPVAEKLERAATTMVKRKKDFSRVAPYLIIDMMHIFQKYNLGSDIKFCFTNMVNAYLSICDKHGISFVKGVLPMGQQELFNNVLENYNKYHRFVGKI